MLAAKDTVDDVDALDVLWHAIRSDDVGVALPLIRAFDQGLAAGRTSPDSAPAGVVDVLAAGPEISDPAELVALHQAVREWTGRHVLTEAMIGMLLADGHTYRTTRHVHASWEPQTSTGGGGGRWRLTERVNGHDVTWTVTNETLVGPSATYERVGPSSFRKNETVEAVQVHVDVVVNTRSSGLDRGSAGSWLVRNSVGESWVEHRDSFGQDYERFFGAGLRARTRQARDRGIRVTLTHKLANWHRYGWLRGKFILAAILTMLFLGIGCWGWVAFGKYDVDSNCFPAGMTVPDGGVHCSDSVWQRLWATVALFSGTYISLSGEWDPMPPPEVGYVAPFALGLTLFTASSLLLLSRRVTDFFLLVYFRLFRRPRLIVVGDGESAAAIIRSCVLQKIPAVLVTDSRDSVAAHATTTAIPIVASGQLDVALQRYIVRALIRRVGHTVVATDTDGANMRLQERIQRIRGRQHVGPVPPTYAGNPGLPINADRPARDLVLIHDPDYAEALLPLTIRDALPDREVTCPTNNVVEQVLHVLIAIATGGPEVHTVDVTIIDCDDSGREPGDGDHRQVTIAPTLRRWITNLDRGLAVLRSSNPSIPTITLASDGQSSNRQVWLYTGRSASAVATRVLADGATGPVRIAITTADLVEAAADMRTAYGGRLTVRTARQWLGDSAGPADAVIVVDPDVVGFDAALVTDDVGTQWARMFDLTYNMLFYTGGWAVTGWLPGEPMADEARDVAARARRHATRIQRITARQQAIVDGGATRASGRSAPGGASPRGGTQHPISVNQPSDPVEKAVFTEMKQITNRYSSEAAVHHMLYLLGETGYELRKREPSAEPLNLAEGVGEYIARMEHHHWFWRRWRRPRYFWQRGELHRVSSYSGTGANYYCFDGLRELSKDEYGETADSGLRGALKYNLMIPTLAYPAIAATWGYRIEPQESIDQIVPPWCTNDLEPCESEVVAGCVNLGLRRADHHFVRVVDTVTVDGEN
ncbi:MAG: hypothetical protein QM662_13010 [Gordonia sp. (in: high G+C Gram-positive bacteria)]